MTNEQTTIEFTDRYGGRAPSWLRACHGDCEAMGWVPIPHYIDPPTENELRVIVEDSSPQDEADWLVAHAAAGEHVCDGWHFIKCRECHGSGRVSWLRAIARVPRWLVKGARFIPEGMDRSKWWEGASFWQRLRVTLYAAWGADLKALRR